MSCVDCSGELVEGYGWSYVLLEFPGRGGVVEEYFCGIGDLPQNFCAKCVLEIGDGHECHLVAVEGFNDELDS